MVLWVGVPVIGPSMYFHSGLACCQISSTVIFVKGNSLVSLLSEVSRASIILIIEECYIILENIR